MAQSRLTGVGEVVEHVALLLAQGVPDRKHAFDEAAARGAVGAEAGVAPQDAVAQGSFGRVVGGLDPFLADEGPQGRLHRQKIGAGGRGLLIGQLPAVPQLEADLRSQVTDVGLEAGAPSRAVTDAMPPSKHLMGALQQYLADPRRLTAAINERLETAFEMGPTRLSLRHRKIVVDGKAVGTNDGRGVFTQQFTGHRTGLGASEW